MNRAEPAAHDGGWIDEASRLPIAFAQVREDPVHDAAVARASSKRANVLMVASGGCTAAYLASFPEIARIHLVDPNSAQLALARLKLALLDRAETHERRELLGHAPLSPSERERRLRPLLDALAIPPESLAPPGQLWTLGPDHCGRYERLFRALHESLAPIRAQVDDLLRLDDPEEQARRASAGTELGLRLDAAIEETFTLETLVRLFGEGATRNPVEPFSRHFARRLRHALATFPARRNPYLRQFLAGSRAPDVETPWLSRPRPDRTTVITLSNEMMLSALAARGGAELDFVHLSNILDWLSPEEARETLELTLEALRPGGWVLIRQLNSSLDVRSLGGGFEWHLPASRALLDADRSFFYREIHLGKRP